jgi:hypothetical protein
MKVASMIFTEAELLGEVNGAAEERGGRHLPLDQ